MTTFENLKDFLRRQNLHYILGADAETVTHEVKDGEKTMMVPAGGVAVALGPIVRASGGIFVARGRTEEDKKVLDKNHKVCVENSQGKYFLKRIFLKPEELDQYYYGFSNQTLWPLCHVTFVRPEFRQDWFEVYKAVNRRFSEAIKQEIKGKTFIWLNDYQLALVPKFLGRPEQTIMALFWHIPWPTWEIFRLLPFKKEILTSLLTCDFIAFHRGYHVRNFLETVERELAVRIDEETGKIYFNKRVTTVKNLPMGIDTDVLKTLAKKGANKTLLGNKDLFAERYKVVLGVDRLDYTKGFLVRLWAFEKFLKDNPQMLGKVIYLGIISPSREVIPLYQELKTKVETLVEEINRKYGQGAWKPIHLIYKTFLRKEIVDFYRRADLCLVTPLDDGMNLVSKEFVITSSLSPHPGMLVLSQFAGSAIDLNSALIVNPFDIEEVAQAIKRGLEMEKKEKKERLKIMREVLEEKNIYEWAREFVANAQIAATENRGRQ